MAECGEENSVKHLEMD